MEQHQASSWSPVLTDANTSLPRPVSVRPSVCWLSVGFRQMEVCQVVFKQARDRQIQINPQQSWFRDRPPDLKVLFGTRVWPWLFALWNQGSMCGRRVCHRAMCQKSRASFISLSSGAAARRKPEQTPELNGHRCPSAKQQLARKRSSAPLWASSGSTIHSFNTIL